MILQNTPIFTLELEGVQINYKLLRIQPFNREIRDWRFSLLDSSVQIEIRDNRNGIAYLYFMENLQKRLRLVSNGESLFYGRITNVKQGNLRVTVTIKTVLEQIKTAKFRYEYDYAFTEPYRSIPKEVVDRFGTSLFYLAPYDVYGTLFEGIFGSWVADKYHDVTYTGIIGTFNSSTFWGTNGERRLLLATEQLKATQFLPDVNYHIYEPENDGALVLNVKSGTRAVISGTTHSLILVDRMPDDLQTSGTYHYYIRYALTYKGRFGTVVEQILSGTNTNLNLGTEWYDRDSLIAAESYMYPLQVKKIVVGEQVGDVIKELRQLMGAVMIDGYINNEGRLVVASIMPLRYDTMNRIIKIDKTIDNPTHEINTESIETKVTYTNGDYSYSVGVGTSKYGFSREVTIENEWIRNANFLDVSAYRRLLLYRNGQQTVITKLPIGWQGSAQIGTIFNLITDMYPEGRRYIIKSVKTTPHLQNDHVSNIRVTGEDYTVLGRNAIGLWTDGSNGIIVSGTSPGGFGTKLGGTDGTVFGINNELGSQFVWW